MAQVSAEMRWPITIGRLRSIASSAAVPDASSTQSPAIIAACALPSRTRTCAAAPAIRSIAARHCALAAGTSTRTAGMSPLQARRGVEEYRQHPFRSRRAGCPATAPGSAHRPTLADGARRGVAIGLRGDFIGQRMTDEHRVDAMRRRSAVPSGTGRARGSALAPIFAAPILAPGPDRWADVSARYARRAASASAPRRG